MMREYWQINVCYRTWRGMHSPGVAKPCVHMVIPPGPFKDARLTPNMLPFKESMSAVRVSMETLLIHLGV